MIDDKGKSSIKKEDFEKVTLPFLGYLYRVAFHLVRQNKDDAEDLVQETYMKAYMSFHQLKDKEKCRAWLTSILHNIFINKYRKEEKIPIIPQSVVESIISLTKWISIFSSLIKLSKMGYSLYFSGVCLLKLQLKQSFHVVRWEISAWFQILFCLP